MASSSHMPLVERLYAATLSPRDWPDAVAALARHVRADHAFLSHADQTWDGGMFVAGAGLDDTDLARFTAYSPRRTAPALAPDLYAPGKVISSADVMSDDEVERSALYNEVIRPARGFYSLTSVGQNASVFNLALCRERRSGAFSRSEAGQIEALAPHVAIALELHHRLRAAEERDAGRLALLDRLNDGVILCEGAGPTFVNRRAQAILDAADGLTLSDGALTAAAITVTRNLRAAIAQAGAPDAGSARRVALPRPSGRLPLVLSILPVGRAGGGFGGGGGDCVAVFITEPGSPPPVSGAILADLFNLTRREAEVAIALAGGASLARVSAVLDLGVGTVRSHLKQVFAKTGVHSQAGLVALMHSCGSLWS